MKILDWIQDEGAALAISLVAAFFAAIGAFVLTIFIGARFFRDEWSYGVPLAFGVPAAVVGGVVVFIIVFRKVRAL
jgi:ABC-type tungstate transport system substrate-binding protein